MKTKAVFFQLHKKREDFFLLILNSHINKRIEGGFRDRSKAAQCSYPSQISLADQSGKCRTKPQRQVFLITIIAVCIEFLFGCYDYVQYLFS